MKDGQRGGVRMFTLLMPFTILSALFPAFSYTRAYVCVCVCVCEEAASFASLQVLRVVLY